MPATTPEHIDQLFQQGMNDADAEAVLGLYEPNAPLVTHTGEIVADPDARRAYLGGFLAMSPKMVLETAKIVQRDDLALVYSTWTVSATDPEGTPIAMAGNSVVTLRRQPDETWLIAIDDPGWLAG